MTNNHNAKYAFYYLLSLVALIFVSISVGLIAFGIISQTVADTLALNSYSDYNGQFRFAISALLIATPIFFVINRFINRGLQAKELDQESGIRRWLTYFILLVSSITVLGIFISVINNFLNGELTLSFILKALTMLIISGSVFSFYLYDIRRADATKKDKVVKIFFFVSLTLIVAAFVSAWFFMESPKEARNRRLDQIVINNIYSLESAVNTYYETRNALPNSMDDLKNTPEIYYNSLAEPIVDASNQEIVYQKINETNFQFCATFLTTSYPSNMATRPTINYGAGSKDHEAGYQCFKSTVWNEKDQALEEKLQMLKDNTAKGQSTTAYPAE
ncbi:MAG: DUF5671 domain-containing protein [Patescibacteria group bacterium]|jgi:hypothetical protein